MCRNDQKRCLICGGRELRKKGAIDSRSLLMCRRCGLQFLDPVPDEKTLESIYADYARIWNLDEFRAQVTQMKKRTFRGYLSATRPFIRAGRLLDIGCATGELLEVFQESDFDVYGVEVSTDVARSCVERFGDRRIIARSIDENDFPPEFFDIITMSDVFEHFRDPRSLIGLMDGILKPGGFLMMTTPDASSLSNRLMGMHWPHYKTEHLYYYSRDNIVRLFSERFDPVLMRPATKALTPRYGLDVLKATSRNRFILRAARGLDWLPPRIACSSFPLMIGEMFVLLQKKKQAKM